MLRIKYNLSFCLKHIDVIDIKVILREVGLMTDFEYVIKSTSN